MHFGLEYPQLKADNFNNWLFRVECLLDEKQLKEVTTQSSETLTGDALVKFGEKDAKAKSIIVHCLSDKHLNLVKDAKNAREMLDILKKLFQRKTVVSKLHLRRKLLTLKCGDHEKLEDYFLKFDNLIRELESTGVKIEELDKVCYLLVGLNSAYDTVITAIETLQVESSVEFVKSRLLDEELKLTSKDNQNESSNEAAFRSIICYRCQKPGHVAHECFENTRGRGQSRRYGRNRGRGRPRGNWRTQSCHLSSAQSNDQLTFVALTANTEMAIETFVLDTGATEHLVQRALEKFMRNVEELKNPVNIVVANNKVMSSYKRGQLLTRINGKEIRIDALIVNDLKFNLLAIRKIVNKGFEVKINKNGLVLYNNKSNFVVRAERVNHLYTLKMELVASSPPALVSAEVWHRRLGHVNRRGMRLLGLPGSKEKCEQCIEGKTCRLPFKDNIRRTRRIGELIHTDICGPITPETTDGHKYFQVIIDDYSHFTMVYLLKRKSEAEENVISYIKQIKADLNVKTARIRMDNGGEFSSTYFKKFCRSKGIKMEYTMAYTPQQNGKSERMNRTLVEKVRIKFIETNLPKFLWGEAIRSSAYELNRSPTSCLKGKTPAEVWFGKNDLSRLRVFGSKAWVVNLKRTNKLQPRAKATRFVGYVRGGYRLWNPEENNIIESRDVIFDESKYKYVQEYENNKRREIEVTEENEAEPGKSGAKSQEREEEQNENAQEIIEDTTENEEEEIEEGKQNEDSSGEINENGDELEESKQRSRSRRVTKRPTYLEEYETYSTFCMLTQATEPDNYEEAVKEKLWQEAIDKELAALQKLETWKEAQLPKNQKAIDTRWVFKTKEDGTRKARLVARGFQVKEDNPFNVHYSPVARLSTVRMMISKAVQENLPIEQLDIPTAFLNGRLKSEIYIKVPQGLKATNKNTVLKLNRALYGLTESPRCWNETINKFAKENGFKRSDYDNCLYYKEDCWMLIYVDDILLIGETKNTKEALKNNFNAKDLGNMKVFLGMEIERNKEQIIIRQTKLIGKVLERFNMQDCNGVKTPMEANLQISDDDRRIEVPFRELVGNLMYLTVTSRPDLAYPVGYLSRYLDRPTEQIWKAGKRVLRYLKETKDAGLIFKKSSGSALHGYSDADWAGDRKDRKSVSGSMLFHGGNPIAWLSKKQNCVSLSTAEAEYIAAATTAQELMNVKGVQEHLGHNNNDEVLLLVDNKGAISMAKNRENSKRTKHVDIKFHFIRDLIEKEELRIDYVSSCQNFADLMTKSLPKQKFYNLINHFLCM